MEVCWNQKRLSAAEIRTLEDEIEKYYTPVPFADGQYFGFTMRLRTGHNPLNSPDVHYTVMMLACDKNMKAFTAGSRVIAEGRPEGPGTQFLLTVVSTFDAEDTYAEAKKRLERVYAYDPQVMVGNCMAWYAHQWNRSWILLPDPALLAVPDGLLLALVWPSAPVPPAAAAAAADGNPQEQGAPDHRHGNDQGLEVHCKFKGAELGPDRSWQHPSLWGL